MLDKPLHNRGGVHVDARNCNWSGQYPHACPHSMGVRAFKIVGLIRSLAQRL